MIRIGSFGIIDKYEQKEPGYLLNWIKVTELIKRRRNNKTYEYWMLEYNHASYIWNNPVNNITKTNKYFYDGVKWTIDGEYGYQLYKKDYAALMESRKQYLTKYSINKVYHAMRCLRILPIELYVEIAIITLLTFKFDC